MRISTSLLLPVFVTAASAASDAKVYLLQGDEFPNTSSPPTLSAEQARLVFAQRLGTSRYHDLGDASKATLSYINKFGRQTKGLFEESLGDEPRELIVVVDGVSSQTAQRLLDTWASVKPTFSISNPPSADANVRLTRDLSSQLGEEKACSFDDTTDPLESWCWHKSSKIIHVDLSKNNKYVDQLVESRMRLEHHVKQNAMNVMVVLMPEESRASKAKKNPYGSYEVPSQDVISRRQAEEPMRDAASESSKTTSKPSSTSSSSSKKPTARPITGVPPVCYSSLDSCINNTNECSGHGDCFKKRGKEGVDACFACGCKVQNETFIHGPKNRTGIRLNYWGGGACQKKDVSGPFWLISIFTVIMVGLVSWSIGLLFSIGEEKLPGVIGAGVSTNRAR